MAAMRCLVLLLWAGVTAASQVDLHKRIFNGRDCLPNERPHHVVLKSDNKTHESLCGGTLISDQWVLTAAHCYKPGWTITATLGNLPRLITHPPALFTDTKGQHDIMLLKLPERTIVTPVKLPVRCLTHPPIGAKVTVPGRARTATQPNQDQDTLGYDHTRPLQCGDFKMVKCVPCTRLDNYVNPKTFCYEEPGKDTTPGDSGGGVMSGDTLYGVHILGGKRLCTKASEAVKICEDIYMEWIVRITNINRPSFG